MVLFYRNIHLHVKDILNQNKQTLLSEDQSSFSLLTRTQANA